MQVAVERGAQTGEGFEVNVTRRARIEAVDEILRHARFLRQPARGHALARGCLVFAEQNGDATRCRNFRTHVLSLQTNGSFVKSFGEESGQVLVWMRGIVVACCVLRVASYLLSRAIFSSLRLYAPLLKGRECLSTGKSSMLNS